MNPRSRAGIAAGALLAAVLAGCAASLARTPDDARLAGDVRRRLAEAGVRNVAAWSVDARHGTVWVFGTAGSQAERTEAESIVRRTPGVERVYPALLVGPYVWTNPAR